MEIEFLGKTLRGQGINGFFSQHDETATGNLGRGFIPTTIFLNLSFEEFKHSDVVFLQKNGIDFIPIDCTEDEEDEMKSNLPREEQEIITKAVSAAREFA